MPTTDPYRIVLADDHVILRQGLKMILEQRLDLRVIGEAGDGLDLLALLDTLTPDMVILDISMPKLKGIEATQRIKRIYPHVKVLILTMHKSQDHVDHALNAGADGYLLKEDANTELFSAIDRIREGGGYISRLLSG
jgi:DNA-binding NarL/FixJ family response regulator